MMLKPVDKKILQVLLENSRLSYREIARKLSIAVATVMTHVQQMEKEGIIKGYTTILDWEKLGYDVQVIIDVRVSKGKLHMMEKRFSKHPNVVAVYDNTGHFDATIVARFLTRRHMDKFLKEIQTYEFVERTETKLVLSTLKEGQIEL
jgi:Lrp/AsnC family transcriptional regulator, regulator for asnA, asnC and gidA